MAEALLSHRLPDLDVELDVDRLPLHEEELAIVYRWAAVLVEVIPLMPDKRREVFLAASADLTRYNLLQPNQAQANRDGVKARRSQWAAIAGGRAAMVSPMITIGGALGGAVAGAILGLLVPETPLTAFVPPVLLTAALGAVGGWILARTFGAPAGYNAGMIRVIANERRSPITPEVVTAQAEAWVPKALLFWRAHEWRYDRGQPYLWVHLPFGQRIHQTLRTTADYLLLPNDLHTAPSAAVYSQRSLNRLISDNAMDFAEADNPDDDGDNPFRELMPYLVAAAVVASGLLLVLLTLD